MKRIFITLLLFYNVSFSQTYPTGQNYPPPTDLITVPTAATLMRGSFSLGMRIQDGGGMILGLRAGITDRFQFGLSYGSSNLIGDDSLRWYPRPEANLKYMLMDESITTPGIAMGLNTQGFGNFNLGDSLNRYDMKAYGFYLSASKNWKTGLGNLGMHGGVSYNFTEIDDGDEDPNLFFGIDIEINPEFSLLMEYNAALNENDMTTETLAISRGGYLNAAIRWTFVEHLHLELNFNNLLFDEDKVDYFKREIKIIYIEYF